VLSFLLMPTLNAYSRFNERQAHRYCFQSVASIEPFISSMNKLAEQNLAEKTPFPLGRVVTPLASCNRKASRRSRSLGFPDWRCSSGSRTMVPGRPLDGLGNI
jgi:Zn-dependent protease with chaperone function